MVSSNVELTPLVLEKIKALYTKIFKSEEDTNNFLQDPQGAFAAHDLDPGILSTVDIDQLVHSCAYPPSGGGGGGGGYAGGGSSSSYVPPPQAVQQVSQVTQQYYQDYSTTVNHIDSSTNIDNSVDVDVDGTVYGDLGVETNNQNVLGDGNVTNQGDGTVVGATGEGDAVYGDKLTAGDGGVVAGGNIDGPINTGVNEGIMADGDVDKAVVGDHNQTAQFDVNQAGGAGGAGGFGGDAAATGGPGFGAGNIGGGGHVGADPLGGEASRTLGGSGGPDLGLGLGAGGDATATGGDASGGDGGSNDVGGININFGNQDSHNTEDSYNTEESYHTDPLSQEQLAEEETEPGGM